MQPGTNLCVYKGETLREKRRASIMEDNQIIKLYFERSEQAIKETDTKYGGYCYSIAYNILASLGATLILYAVSFVSYY